ncbi:PhoX family phosphatase [Roseateles sp. DAIF2]|uniref:PhoX family protein n=1 Tax=Roseateles sp. DAIF2 TaxID=2714952 RepID=UPI0018A28EEC|nr:PhoX family phosphatase [Roseateles sp. DAIF2]QPF73077.1 PhoX family phosphatase [Roseateles sp. DAIF2]
MKGIKHPRNDQTLNPSGNVSIHTVIDAVDDSRRLFVKGSASASALAAAGGLTLSGLSATVEAAPVPASLGFPGIGFENVPASLAPVADRVRVPAGYTAELFVAWGDPIVAGGTAFAPDASNSAAEQARQYGAHTDGMAFIPFTGTDGKPSAERGLLCANNEYTHEEILHADGQANFSIAKARKSQAAHGVSVLEARRRDGKWSVVRNSPYGRRITANTRMRVSGPAAGHALLKTVEFQIGEQGSFATGRSSDGFTAYGTVNNCANGITPWGTYLTCEENWNGNFGASAALPATGANEAGKLYNRYGVVAAGFGYRWHEVDPRFDLATNPNEANLFGWVVEIDPFDPKSVPVKRTALGRFKHESAQYVVDDEGYLAVYMGDDERNEYIYKFVSAAKFNPGNRAANRELLDSGTLYVAQFGADLRGRWIALLPGTLGVDGVALRDNPNFAGANDAEVLAKILIKARMAGDAVGATMMDRPEWTGARPRIGGFKKIEIYCTLTNNNRRGSATPASANKADGSTTAASARPAVDAANPRADNIYGHIIRWREDGDSVRATGFGWDLFVQAGDTRTAKAPKPSNDYKGNIVDAPDGEADYGAPDGLWFDPFGRLWVQTDQAGDASGDWKNIGANSMVCVDPNSGTTRRFLTAPPNAEVTGITMSPDGRALFVGIQHPGEGAPPHNPEQFSRWPASQWGTASDGVTALPFGRPRSAVVVVTKNDGGVIGS